MIDPVKIQVRFSDLDVLGHVNNSIYLSYFEIARVKYFGKMLGQNWDWTKNGVILVKNTVEYLKPVLLNDVPFISIFVDKIGSKSFELSYELKVDNQIRTIGSSILVCFNAIKNETILIPEVMMEALERMKKE